MKYSLLVLAVALTVLVFLGCGCESSALRWEPVVRVVYMPKKFEDGRIMVNPWREPSEVPYGPSYPYELVYNPSSNLYEIVMRKEAPSQPAGILSYKRDADPYTLIVPVRE